MKPAPFDYRPARSLPDALRLLGEPGAKALAGGQSLVPLLNFRLARPALLVDLNPVTELSYLRRSGGVLRIGALTRQAVLERSQLVARGWPLLREAVAMVAHSAIRNRGTVGGSVAHADPKAELPVALTALGARFHVRSERGARALTAEEMFRGPMMTALEADELLTEIEIPPPPEGSRMAFVEYARTHGDFALAGAALVLAPGEHAALTLLGAGSTPRRALAAERALVQGAGDDEAGALAAAGIEDRYQRALLSALVARAVRRTRA
jgi:CO/xanthine dehydrogenase FAD-binding subunit